ncbi:thioredoxin family protein [uncultured Desulfosarcina sp.]|uniref:thioredoxin family protein n=1 Tax=uncultured Desulfosarcina sp. TaxID=218289 RepID=UPI0029C90E78|nr:thioredoxin family protein [uncultured Desulfosarcina sp.]
MSRENDKERIRQWGEGKTDEIVLRFATTGQPMDEQFKTFADSLAELAPCVRVKKDGDAPVTLPSLLVGSRVTYQALPHDRELEPFLAMLADAFSDRVSAEVRQRLAQLTLPALVKVYVTSFCPHCPNVVALLLGLAAVSDQVRVTVIDGELFPDAAVKDKVSAAPTVILDDQFRWTGSVDAAELVTLMLDRDPASLGPDALRSMIEDGNAEGVARMMSRRGRIFDAFIDLLAHQRWSVRLGAMVAFESLVEADAELAEGIVQPLTALFEKVDDMVKGDLLHVLGESGSRAALPFLEGVAAGDHDEEVQEAAREAVEKLQEDA